MGVGWWGCVRKGWEAVANPLINDWRVHGLH